MPTKVKIFHASICIYFNKKNVAVITISRFTIERIQPVTRLLIGFLFQPATCTVYNMGLIFIPIVIAFYFEKIHAYVISECEESDSMQIQPVKYGCHGDIVTI